MKIPYQNNEVDEISIIIEKTPGLIEQNEIKSISSLMPSCENNVSYLESFNDSLNNNLPIFGIQEEEKKNNSMEEELNSIEKKELYLIEKLNNLDISPRNPFMVLNRKRRGRVKKKRNQEEINEKEDKDNKIHDKNRADNLLRKIQVHYLSFIVEFINEILAFLNIKVIFFDLDHKFKNHIKKEFVNSLKERTIGDIICSRISPKYKKDINHNKIIYETTKVYNVLNKIYSENYLLFFRNIYFTSNKKINLSKYGLNKEIMLSDKVKMYKDLIKNKDIVHKRNIYNCLRNNFLDNPLFRIE